MQEMTHGLFVDLGKLQQFHNVHTSFAAFAFRKKGMRPAHEGGYFPLGKIFLLTGSDEPF
jgi:hypothetical protein